MKLTKLFMVLTLICAVGCTESKKEKEDAGITQETVSTDGSFNINADDRLIKTTLVESGADNVWGLLRELDDVDKYSSNIAKVEFTGNKGVGGERVCTSPEEKGFFKEKIIAFDDQYRTYSYAVVEGVPVKGMVNTFKVVNLGYNKSAIVWSTNYNEFMENPDMDEEQFMVFLDQASQETLQNVALAAVK